MAVLLTLGGLSWVIWSVYSVNLRGAASQNDWLHDVYEIQSDIARLDGMLTMSARMAVETGEAQWERRYKKNVPALKAAIEQALKLVPGIRDTENMAAVEQARARLSEIENQAFTLIQQGSRKKARELLLSPEHFEQKRNLSVGMNLFHRALHEAIDDAQKNRIRLNRAQISVMAGIMLVLFFSWLVVYRLLGSWRRKINMEVNLRQQLLESTKEGYWRIDLEGMTQDVNRAMCRILGRQKNEVIGRSVFEFVDDENAKIIKSEIAARKLGKVGAYEIAFRRPDGENIHCLNNATPVVDSNGVQIGSVGMFSDISNLKAVTQKLALSAIEAQKANKVKSDLMANMSHELRTPLNAILGFSDTMQQEVFGPLGNDKYREYLNDIHDSGQHLLDLINDILDISAIEANALELQEKDVSLSEAVDAAVRLIRSRAENGKILLSSFVEPHIPRVFLDERRVKQVLLNLLSNAVKFTPEHGKVSLRAWLNNDYSLSIAVSDTGIGMSEDEIETALSTFGQIDSGLNRKHEGTGLGLPLTKKLVELHGGKITVKSKKGEGTSVMVTLPKERVQGNVSIWSKLANSWS